MILLVVVGVAVAAASGGYLLGRRFGQTRPTSRSRGSAVRSAAPAAEQAGSAVDIERALADLRLGVIVVAGDGTEIYRNHQAQKFASGRHGDALVEAALQRVLEGALVGLSLEESLEVYGPPARSILIQASPTYDGGSLGGAVGVIDDVTEARRIDRVRSDFVANVSHELRTPVGAMSVLAEAIAGSDDPEVIDRLSTRMQREANRLGNTIEDLLALSRLESGPVSDPETIDLLSVASRAIERTDEAAQQRGVLVELDNEFGGPVLIDGDSGQLISAVANLVENAIKYSDSGSRVLLQVRLRSGAELSVVDSGIGIPDRDLDRIFERFYRVDSARSRETGGTGLGLSIVRHALLNHGGRIDVVSQEGEGSTFTISLPVSSAQAQVVEASAGSPAATTTTTNDGNDGSDGRSAGPVDTHGANDV